ncbi:MAG: hypothetical protein WBE43_12215 [Candidatus Acidiferrales bacterium]
MAHPHGKRHAEGVANDSADRAENANFGKKQPHNFLNRATEGFHQSDVLAALHGESGHGGENTERGEDENQKTSGENEKANAVEKLAFGIRDLRNGLHIESRKRRLEMSGDGANLIGRAGNAELDELNFSVERSEALRDRKIDENLIVLRAARVDDAADGEAGGTTLIGQVDVAAHGETEATAGVASHKAMRKIGAGERCDTGDFPRRRDLRDAIEPRPGDDDVLSRIRTGAHDEIEVRRGVNAGCLRLRDGLHRGFVEKRGHARRGRGGLWRGDDEVRAEGTEFLGEFAIDVEIKIQKRGNNSAAADEREQRDGEPDAIAAEQMK